MARSLHDLFELVDSHLISRDGCNDVIEGDPPPEEGRVQDLVSFAGYG
jgi:hypothetical protein